jgi:hypothetical protein
MPTWYILWSFGIFFPVLVSCATKNLATLIFFAGEKSFSGETAAELKILLRSLI